MIWHSWSDFFAMGGYALYVWGSFGVCAVAFMVEPLWVRKQHKAALQTIRRQQQAEILEMEHV